MVVVEYESATVPDLVNVDDLQPEANESEKRIIELALAELSEADYALVAGNIAQEPIPAAEVGRRFKRLNLILRGHDPDAKPDLTDIDTILDAERFRWLVRIGEATGMEVWTEIHDGRTVFSINNGKSWHDGLRAAIDVAAL